MKLFKGFSTVAAAIALFLCAFATTAAASEIDLNIPTLDVGYNFWGHTITGAQILLYGLVVCALGAIFGLYEFFKGRFYSVEQFDCYKKNESPDVYLKFCSEKRSRNNLLQIKK